MSFGWTAATWAAIGTAAVSAYSADSSRATANKGRDQAKQLALQQQAEADRANNKASARSPDVGGLMAAATLASRGGQAGTMLTGPDGIDAATLKLGKTNPLGG